MKDVLAQLNTNIEFVTFCIRNSKDEEEKAGLEKLLNDYEVLKTKIEGKIAGNNCVPVIPAGNP